MSAASWLIEKIFRVSGAAGPLSAEKFHKKLRKSAIRYKRGEKVKGRFLGVRVESGVYCGMRYYVFIPKEIDTSKILMYAHGSGYMNTHRCVQERFAAALAKNTHAKVYFPIYPKLPMETVVSCFAVMNNFLSFLLRKGGKVVLVGDSSGASLCLALAAERREIENVVAISPWLLLPPGKEAKEINTDVVLSLDMLERVGELWHYDLPLDHPRVSPFYGNYKDKELYLVAGECERFCAEIDRFAKEKRGECRSIECRIAKNQQHCFPLMPSPEGREARMDICRKLHEWLYGRGV